MSANWDQRYMDLALHVATWSKDPSTKVGAVIVNLENRIVSVGYNGFPKGVEDTEERYNDKVLKYMFVSHAERNALDNAPVSLAWCTVYSTLFPCNECCKSMIARGITKIVTVSPVHGNHNPAVTQLMCKESGVVIQII